MDDDQDLLGEMGFLPSSDSSEDEATATVAGPSRSHSKRTVVRSEPSSRGAPWFEEIVRNTRLGRFKQHRGGHSASAIQVEWEVTEWTEGDTDELVSSGQATPTKRKIGDVEADDSEMRNA